MKWIASVTTLKVADRCDKCGAQAFVQVVFGNGHDLLFCGHHYAAFQGALPDATVHDHRESINKEASVSSP
jgi:hypothetical protein